MRRRVRQRRPLASVRLAPVVLAGLALAALPGVASAVGVTVTGDDGRPLAIDPAAPPSIRTLRPTVAVTGDAGGGRYSVAFGDPAGKPAAGPVACLDPATPTSVRLPFHGNGRYTVAVTTFAAAPAIVAASQPVRLSSSCPTGSTTKSASTSAPPATATSTCARATVARRAVANAAHPAHRASPVQSSATASIAIF
jgi:hypothetical protein